MTDSENCWLCLRITPQDLARAIHALFPEHMAHQVLEESAKYVQRAYTRNPTYLCGKSAYRIIGGLLYLLGFKLGYRLTQDDIADKLNYLTRTKRRSDVTIRKGYRDWQHLFPKELRDAISKDSVRLQDKAKRQIIVLLTSGSMRFYELYGAVEDKVGLSTATFNNALKELMNKGFVKREAKARQKVFYSLTDD